MLNPYTLWVGLWPGVEPKLLNIHCSESPHHEVQRTANDIVILKLDCEAAFTQMHDHLQLGCSWRSPSWLLQLVTHHKR